MTTKDVNSYPTVMAPVSPQHLQPGYMHGNVCMAMRRKFEFTVLIIEPTHAVQ